MDKRMFGLDSEYSITCVFDGEQRLSPDEVARDLFGSIASGAAVLLRNGARLNLKVPAHPEYATPDCATLPELIAQDKAGERILEDLAAAAQTRLPDADIRVLKTGHCRETYLLTHHGEFGRLGPVP